MTQGTYTQDLYVPRVSRLYGWRLAALLLGLMVVIVAGGIYVLKTYGRKLGAKATPAATHTAATKQSWAYEPEAPAKGSAAQSADPNTELLRQMAKLQGELNEQRDILEGLLRRKEPTGGKQEKASPVRRGQPTPMLVISNDVAEPPSDADVPTYTLAPAATKIACQIETAMNSNVSDSYFIAVVTTNVYDTKTGHHLLIPQGASILGNNQSSKLLYGDERMDTVSLTLSIGAKSYDLGRAPVTDQLGVGGLTGEVDQHYWRLFGAVFIGGALKGGMSAMQVAMSEAAGAGQVTSGLTSLGHQATNRVVSPMLNTRPTIEVDAGQLCQVLLLQPLHLPAMWQQSEPREVTRSTQAAARELLPRSPRR